MGDTKERDREKVSSHDVNDIKFGSRYSVSNSKSPVDHGHAWLIVAAAGLSFFIGAGFIKSYTMVYEQLLWKFGKSATETALVGSLHGGVKMCSSPIVGALVNMFGTQRVTIAGGAIGFVGFMMSSFPPNLYYMYLSHGVISAIGTNMVHCSAFIMVGQYFDRKRGTAMGLATSCTGLGGFAVSLIFHFLFIEYGYSGTMLIYAGATLNYIAVGLIYQPIPAKYLSDPSQQKGLPVKTEDAQSDILYHSTLSLAAPGAVSMEHLSSGKQSLKPDPPRDSVRIRVLKRTLSSETASNSTRNIPSSNSPRLTQKCNGTVTSDSATNSTLHIPNCASPMLNPQLNRSVSCGTATNSKLNNPNSASQMLNSKFEDDGEIEDLEETVDPENRCAKIKTHFGFFLLKHFDFLALMFLMFGAFTAFSVSSFLMGLGREILQLTSSDISLLLAVASSIDIISRPASGVLFDLKMIQPFKMELWLAIGVCCGASLIALPFSTSYWMFFTLWCCYGLMAGCFHTQHIGIVSDVVGSRNLASAMGLIRFMMGGGLVVGPTIGGILKDTSGSYIGAFIVAGSFIIVFAVLFKVVQCVRKRFIVK